MNVKSKLFITLYLFPSILCFCQVKGTCVDENGVGIPYVNISVKKKPIGTVSSTDGHFFLNKKNIIKNDSLIFSHLNFEKRTIAFPLKNSEIKLKSKFENLKEVIITSKKRKFKEKTIGTKTKSDHVVLSMTSKNLGTEIGKIIKVKSNKSYKLKTLNFNIAKLAYKTVSFRINFYKITNGNINLNKVNKKDIIIKITKKGIVAIDLSKYNMFFENDFLTSIEWIDYVKSNNIKKENTKILFSSTVFSGPFISRDNINLKWKTNKLKFNVGLGIYLRIEQYSK